MKYIFLCTETFKGSIIQWSQATECGVGHCGNEHFLVTVGMGSLQMVFKGLERKGHCEHISFSDISKHCMFMSWLSVWGWYCMTHYSYFVWKKIYFVEAYHRFNQQLRVCWKIKWTIRKVGHVSDRRSISLTHQALADFIYKALWVCQSDVCMWPAEMSNSASENN